MKSIKKENKKAKKIKGLEGYKMSSIDRGKNKTMRNITKNVTKNIAKLAMAITSITFLVFVTGCAGKPKNIFENIFGPTPAQIQAQKQAEHAAKVKQRKLAKQSRRQEYEVSDELQADLTNPSKERKYLLSNGHQYQAGSKN